MQFNKTELTNGHFYLQQLERGKNYKVTFKHDGMAKFIVELLNLDTHTIIDRPNEYLVTALPNVPYSISFKAYGEGMLAIHYDEKTLDAAKWTKVYDIVLEEVK